MLSTGRSRAPGAAHFAAPRRGERAGNRKGDLRQARRRVGAEHCFGTGECWPERRDLFDDGRFVFLFFVVHLVSDLFYTLTPFENFEK